MHFGGEIKQNSLESKGELTLRYVPKGIFDAKSQQKLTCRRFACRSDGLSVHRLRATTSHSDRLECALHGGYVSW